MTSATLNYTGQILGTDLRAYTINKAVFLESDGTQNNIGMIKNVSIAPKEEFKEIIDNSPIPSLVQKILIRTGGTIEFDAYEFSAANMEAAFGAELDDNNRYYMGSNEGVIRKVQLFGQCRVTNKICCIGIFKAEIRGSLGLTGNVEEQGTHFVCDSLLDSDGTYLAKINPTTLQREHMFFMPDVADDDAEATYSAAASTPE